MRDELECFLIWSPFVSSLARPPNPFGHRASPSRRTLPFQPTKRSNESQERQNRGGSQSQRLGKPTTHSHSQLRQNKDQRHRPLHVLRTFDTVHYHVRELVSTGVRSLLSDCTFRAVDHYLQIPTLASWTGRVMPSFTSTSISLLDFSFARDNRGSVSSKAKI